MERPDRRKDRMRRSRLYDAGSFVLLALVGVISLTNPLSRTVLSGSWHACVEATGGIARLGLHFDVFEPSVNCPMDSYAPGPNFAQAGQFSIFISLSAVACGLVLLLATLGAGRWLRATARAAQIWIGRLIGSRPAQLVVRNSSTSPLLTRIADLRGAVLARPHSRRGPPLLAPA